MYTGWDSRRLTTRAIDSHRRSSHRDDDARGSRLRTSQHPGCGARPGRSAQSVKQLSHVQAQARARAWVPRVVGAATARLPPAQCCQEHLWPPMWRRRAVWIQRSPSYTQPATTAPSSTLPPCSTAQLARRSLTSSSWKRQLHASIDAEMHAVRPRGGVQTAISGHF